MSGKRKSSILTAHTSVFEAEFSLLSILIHLLTHINALIRAQIILESGHVAVALFSSALVNHIKPEIINHTDAVFKAGNIAGVEGIVGFSGRLKEGETEFDFLSGQEF